MCGLEYDPLPGYRDCMSSFAGILEQVARPVQSRALWRAMFAMIISAALALSLMQMPCCDGFAAESSVAVENIDLGPQNPSHVPAGHCDHCLVHVAFPQFVNPIEVRIEFGSAATTLPNDAAPASVAGLPLFKPPRA